MTYIYRTDDNETDEIIYFAVNADNETTAKQKCLDQLIRIYRMENPYKYDVKDLAKTKEQQVIASVIAVYNQSKPSSAPYIEYTRGKKFLTPTEFFTIAECFFILDSTIPENYIADRREVFWLRYEPDSDHIKVVSQWVAGLWRETTIND